jgi:hypothetical protein
MRVCGTETGVCRPGLQHCNSDGRWGDCLGSVQPTAEVCDALDNDCDGTIDEDYGIYPCGTGGCGGFKICSTQGKTCPGGDPKGCKIDNPLAPKDIRTCSSYNIILDPDYQRDCGVCCKCGVDNVNPEETYDDTQDSDCRAATCPADACGKNDSVVKGKCTDGGGDNMFGMYMLSGHPNTCSGLKTCTADACGAAEVVCVGDTDDDDYSGPRGSNCYDCDQSGVPTTGLGARRNAGITERGPFICDGIDNDCDGLTDELYPNGENNCQTSKICCAGNTSCTGRNFCMGGQEWCYELLSDPCC